MASEHFLVTGAFGCIGSWVVKRLVEEGTPVTTYDLPGEPVRMRIIMEPEQIDQVQMLAGDITDAAAFEKAVVDNGITHVIHLAALQVPFVRANPILGAQVNVVGSAIVLETVKKHRDQVRGLAYASSVAVYGPPSDYPPGPLAHDAPFRPTTLYGVTKEANEHWAEIYWQDYQLPSVGLRPFFVYGPGRDQGVSSTPSKAMVAAAFGRPYKISFGGIALYQHADDVADSFIRAVRTMPEGAPVYNLGGSLVPVSEIVTAIETVVPEMAGKITYEPEPLFTPEGTDSSAFESYIGPFNWRDLTQGVRDTVEVVRAAEKRGHFDIERAIN